MTDDDKVVLVAERISERVLLKKISDLIPDKHAHETSGMTVSKFIEDVIGWIPNDPRLQLMLGDANKSEQYSCVTDAVRRTRQAISRFSSMAPKPDDYFWFMVEQIHGKDGMKRLTSLSSSLREKAKTMQKVKVAA